jgi:coenzyme F420-reducing hydrogenase beta subunit
MRSPEPGISPKTIVASGLCIGCGSCASRARADGAHVRWDRDGFFKPAGPQPWYDAGDEDFPQLCPFSPAARDEDELAAHLFPLAPRRDGRIGRFAAAYVGHAEEQEFRRSGSSGGMVSWVASELLRKGLVDGVAHVAPSDPAAGRLFDYRISRTNAEVRTGAKSRYYPVELSGVLDEIRRVPGRYAIVGVPCFIKAINLLRLEDPLMGERIAFTLGLYCGHMKSARMVDSFAWQMGVPPDQVQAVDFRVKNADRPANWYRTRLELQSGGAAEQDWWHLVDGDWGAGFFQNSACNFCDDVVAETADISFGDAWVEPYSSDGRGTNVVVVRSELLHRIVEEARSDGRLTLDAVDADFIAQTQAAGFRQRREGLSLRLARRKRGLQPKKRVPAVEPLLPARRRIVYGLRQSITRWSHRMFRLARLTRRPALYRHWGKFVLSLYQAVTYSRGRLGGWIDGVEKRLTGHSPTSA